MQIYSNLTKGRVGLCHGCFDLIHYGHILHFKKAKSYCDYLIVSLSDDSIACKSKGRPIYSLNERVGIIRELRCIDQVITCEDATSENLLRKIKPNFYFKGIDYKDSEDKRLKKELDVCKEISCKIIITSTEKYSTTDFIKKCSLVSLR